MLSLRFENSTHPLRKLDWVLDQLSVGERLPPEKQLPPLTLEQERLVTLYTECLSEAREHYKDSVSLKSLWLFLNKLKWRYPDDLFEKLRHEDVVEVYSLDHTQIFRSYTFFKYCSYTLEDLHFRPWFELYQRDGEVMQKAMVWLERVINDEIKGICYLDLPTHWISELDSDMPFHLQLRYRVGTILRASDGTPKGYLVSNQVISSRRGH